MKTFVTRLIIVITYFFLNIFIYADSVILDKYFLLLQHKICSLIFWWNKDVLLFYCYLLFIVTVASFMMLTLVKKNYWICGLFVTSVPLLYDSFGFLFYANSVVNPVLYTLSMPDFREALFSFCTIDPTRSQLQFFVLTRCSSLYSRTALTLSQASFEQRNVKWSE